MKPEARSQTRLKRLSRIKLRVFTCYIAIIVSAALISMGRSHGMRVESVLPSENKLSFTDWSVQHACTAPVTLVTSYHSTKGKHNEGEYKMWNRRFLALADSMVIFTDSWHVDEFRSQRARSRGCTLIVPYSLKHAYRRWNIDWNKQNKLDPEKNVHKTTDLYVIWNQKSALLADVAERNPFGSKHIFWADIGQFRDNIFINKYLKPSMLWVKETEFLPKGKILFLAIERFLPEELKLDLTGASAPIDSMKVRLGGGNFGGDIDAVRLWAVLFDRKVEYYVSKGAFAGKDQPIYGSICIETNICHVVDASAIKGISDPWFALQPVLHGAVRQVPLYNWSITSSLVQAD